MPPSLKLPEVVTDLAAVRVGDAVRLSWTTPSRTTDGLNLAGTTTAEICRETLGGAVPAPRPASGQACAPIARMVVTPGLSEAVSPLAGPLGTGPAVLLAYRVQLRSAKGRTAGPSAEVFAASGRAPVPVEELKATAAKGAAVLEWRAGGQAGDDVVELDRTTVADAAVTPAVGKAGLPAKPKEPVEVKMRAGRGAGASGLVGSDSVRSDAGGTMDRTAVTGKTYRYTAARVRTVRLGGQRLEIRSVESGGVTVVMRDVFPPDAPAGLVASPGFVTSPGVGGDAAASASSIDLSWEPAMEAGIVGYRVYRREEGGEFQRLGTGMVGVPAYRDGTVVAGRSYQYRVTAVDGAGNESLASGEAEETAPER